MDLPTRIKLIDDLIKENPDVTIKDFLEALKEISAVESATVIELVTNLKKAK